MAKKRNEITVHPPKKRRNSKLLLYYFFIITFGLTYHMMSNQEWFLFIAKPIFNWYASLSSGILNLLCQETAVVGDQINSSVFSLQIKEGCDGITPMVLYSVAILAFPIKMKLKWPGVFYGLLLLIILNFVRIISLYFAGKYGSQGFFDFMHEDFWAILFLVIAVILWLNWMKWALVTKAEKLD